MTHKTVWMSAGGIAAAVALAALLGGCPANYTNYLFEEISGNVTVQFVNDTDFRASFSYGAWNEFDRTPGPVTFDQLVIAPHTSSTLQTVTCRRNFAIGTQKFVDRVLATDADNVTDFIPEAFATVVHFSDAPSDSDAASLPTVGTAAGLERLLGIDYSCADRLIFTFVEDPDAAGGFRIDYEVIMDDDQAS